MQIREKKTAHLHNTQKKTLFITARTRILDKSTKVPYRYFFTKICKQRWENGGKEDLGILENIFL